MGYSSNITYNCAVVLSISTAGIWQCDSQVWITAIHADAQYYIMLVSVILLFNYKQGNNINYLMYQTKTGQIVAVYFLDPNFQISQSIIFCVSLKKGKDLKLVWISICEWSRVSKRSVISRLPLRVVHFFKTNLTSTNKQTNKKPPKVQYSFWKWLC